MTRFSKKLVIRRDDYKYAEILLIIIISVVPYFSIMVKIGLLIGLVLLNITQINRLSKCYFISLVLMVIPSVLDVYNITDYNAYSGNNYYFPLSFLVGALLAKKYTLDEFLFILEKVLYILGLLSLVGMSIYYIAPTMINQFPTYSFYGLTHRTLYFFNFIYADGFLMVRNSGIAWEPGVFQILMNLGLAISTRNRATIDYKKTAVYILAIVLTRSTIGLLILMVNLVVLVRKNRWFLLVIAIIVVIFSGDIISIISYQATNKWIGSLAFTNRFTVSYNAIINCYKYPFGLGSTGYNAVYERLNIGSFDSYTQILMRYGYGLLAFIIFALYKIFRKHWYLGIILIMSLLTESMWSSVLFVFFYFVYLEDSAKEKAILYNYAAHDRKRLFSIGRRKCL